MSRKRQNLINARHEAKLTQSELGNLVGATKKRISALETAACGTRTALWDRLEEVLGVHQRILREICNDSESSQPDYSNNGTSVKAEVA
jgi:transcriptional regulator with XRE-family HTH domain